MSLGPTIALRPRRFAGGAVLLGFVALLIGVVSPALGAALGFALLGLIAGYSLSGSV